MDKLYQAREEILAAALDVVSFRIERESRPPNVHDEASTEMRDDRLELAIEKYIELKSTPVPLPNDSQKMRAEDIPVIGADELAPEERPEHAEARAEALRQATRKREEDPDTPKIPFDDDPGKVTRGQA